jgi:hydrogenase-4 component B
MEEHGCLIRKMPWTAFLFLVGAVSVSALPPSDGFVSEWLTFQSLFLSYQIPDVLIKIVLPIGAAVLALTGALALACFAKAFGISFLAMPRSAHARETQEVPWAMRIGMGEMAFFCIILAIAPQWVIPLINRITAPFIGASIADHILSENGLTVIPMGVGFASVSTPVLAALLAILIPVGLLLVVSFGGRLRKRYYKTWGCGINLKPRMEYTAAGFTQPIKQVFSMIYRPTVKLESEMLEESRYFAKRMHFETNIEPVFQKYLYNPVVRVLSFLANRLRVVQAGSLHLYLTYIFLTLLVLLLWAR